MAGISSKNVRHALADRKDDFYATPREAIEAFIAVEGDRLPSTIWEPACGDGAIVLPLRETGRAVIATDLVSRGCPESEARIDFLMNAPRFEVGGIVTNPPFKLATEFVQASLDRAPYVAMLMRLNFLEGGARKSFFENSPLARVHVASRRLPMMHRDGWDGPKSGSAIAYAWFVWDKAHTGSPEIQWFDWKEHAREAA